MLAHRVSYWISNGPFDKRLFVCHRCDHPPCVNPAHLFLGTARDNQRDKFAKGRGTTKLTADDVLVIRSSSEGQAEIARRYGVSQPTISNIRRRKYWSHVP